MVNMYIKKQYSSLSFPSVECVANCDTCTDALNICANCADGYDMEPVCTGKKQINNHQMWT